MSCLHDHGTTSAPAPSSSSPAWGLTCFSASVSSYISDEKDAFP
jgi:hypothetical protein